MSSRYFAGECAYDDHDADHDAGVFGGADDDNYGNDNVGDCEGDDDDDNDDDHDAGDFDDDDEVREGLAL